MQIYWDVEQRSEAWDRLRLGIPTASSFSKIVTPAGKLSTQADKFLDSLLAEWMFGGPLEDPETQFRSQWMERGIFMEQQAYQSYEFETDNETRKVGFVATDDGLIGCSPDRFIVSGEKIIRGLELKCPSPAVHARYMRTGSIETDYKPQIQGCMMVCELDSWDVQSYCPPFPSVIVPVQRDEAYIKTLRCALEEFTDKILEAREYLTKRYPTIRQAA